MARRGGRRGRRSRSRQNRSRRTSSRTRSRRTTTRRSAPSSRRNTRTTTRASNRRATVSKARRAAPKKAAPKKKAPTRRATPSNRRATVSKKRQATRSAPKRAVNASRGRAPTSRRQATRTTRQASPTRRNTRIASYDNRQFKSVPATGVRGDQPASSKYKEGMLQKNIKPSTPNNIFGLALNTITGMNAAQAQPMNTRPKMLANLPKDYKQQEQALSAAAKPLGNPNVMSSDGTFNRPGPGGPEPEADYTSYQPGSFYNLSDTNRMNMTNLLRSGHNLVTSPFRAMGIENRLTNKLIPKSNEAIQDARDNRRPRPTLKRRGGSGGASRIAQQAAATQMQPEIAPTIGTPTEGPLANLPFHGDTFGEGSGELNRIQNQAYNTQLTTNLSNMFGGQGSVGYVPQGDTALSPTLRAGRSRGRRRVRMFGARRRRGGTGDQFSRAGDRIAKLTNINI